MAHMFRNIAAHALNLVYSNTKILNREIINFFFEMHISSQESMVIEVPRLKDIPTDVTPNLQDRLNGVTDVLSRVSKLVYEDLEKAVSSAVGQDKDGNLSVGTMFPL